MRRVALPALLLPTLACSVSAPPPTDAPPSATAASIRAVMSPLALAQRRIAGRAPTTSPKGPTKLTRVFDVNGDGFGDLLLGCLDRALLFHGSAAGLTPTPALTLPGLFGFKPLLTDLGDIDDDRRSDFAYSGAIYGTASGLAAPLGHVDYEVQRDAGHVADVDGDGWPELFVDPQHGEPFAWKSGGKDGFIDREVLRSPRGEKHFGLESMLSFSDVDGDGLLDALAGARELEADPSDRGRIVVLRGNPAGLVSAPWLVTAPRTPTLDRSYTPGWTLLLGTGDVNGDGFGDFIAGSYEGAYVFYGAASAHAVVDTAFLGRVDVEQSSAGDFNGDGMTDLAAGFRRRGSGVAIYMGAARGFSREPDLVIDTPSDLAPCGFTTLGGAP